MTYPVAATGAPATGTATGPFSGYSPAGVRLQRLKVGRASEILFIVPGLEGDPDELTLIVASMTGPQEVIALAPLAEDGEHPGDVTIERIASRMFEVVRHLQRSGPYRLAGYSFGGLIALELAQQLRAAGETVRPVFLIDAVYDERYWPRGIWIRALIRRSRRQLLRIARMRPDKGFVEMRRRGGRLIQRLRRRGSDRSAPVTPIEADGGPMVERAHTAIAEYRPRFYGGSITLVVSAIDRHFGCDTADLWAGYADRIDVKRVDADHLTIAHDPVSAAAVAEVIDRGLLLYQEGWLGLRPTPGFERPMILTTMRWFSGARLGHALTEAGFQTSTCRPRGHPLGLVDGLAADCRLRKFWPVRSLTRAIRRAEPDIVLADDERALVLLRRLHRRLRSSDPDLAAVVGRSLGHVEDWPVIASRTGLEHEAEALGIVAPKTDLVESLTELSAWVSESGLPIALKTDGSWGGRGVAVVRDADRIPDIWRSISNPPKLPRALKRLVFDLDTDSLVAFLRHQRPVVNIQQFVDGREAIVTAACLDGKVQALVCLEVVQASEPRGPASVVRIIEHPAMAEAARILIDRFGLSGFCGFDFILTADGGAYLLEVNPRVTPTCHLLVEGECDRSRTIVLFPAELMREPDPDAPAIGVLDLPVRAPLLIRRGRRLVARHNRPAARLVRRVERRFSSSRY